ncbi:glycine/D-amino acid oxidase-like deaminating enzyme [Litoreibacter meonggei]|uniref:Glycine/D-amino acid oxidase-like deaminating enzyme n=1 Tax=Litoreibacter meonggei TaxID=1049199 RepID=A0A497WRV0_9RHOB|nr:FAD-dependent oxidoreductase [Litoreibacter meonggei]RLJ59370.1 glycine/D-amino acid oxidase-like deaminating enzyme [Litoreibacter meonggei]
MIDFLVIGGGIAGASAAARLSELGSVTLLEREHALAYHASGRSAAMFEETYGKPSTIALNRASKEWHLEINRSCDLPRGLMLLGHEDNKIAFGTDIVSMQLRRLTIEEALEIFPILDPDRVTQVGYHESAWDIDTDAAIQRFIRHMRSNGGTVVTRAEVSAIERTKRGWRVSAGEDYEARQIVNAAGAWADQIAHMASIAPLGLQPMRRSIARVAAPSGYDVSRWPLLFGPGENWYAKPDAGALLISPADEEPVLPVDAWAVDMVLAEGIARYEEHVTAPVQRMIANWAGLRTFAPDRCLVIGASEQDGFWWCAGQGGYGFQTAPAASQLLADLIGGRTSELDAGAIAALSPARFGSD